VGFQPEWSKERHVGLILIWDYDGTLFDTAEAITHCLALTANDFGLIHLERSEISAAISSGSTVEEVFFELWSVPADALPTMVKVYRQHYASAGFIFEQPFLYIPELLAKLASIGTNNVIVSNKGSVAIASALERYDLTTYFDSIFGADNHSLRKPDPALFSSAIQPLYNGNTDSVVIIGDTATDCAFARNCNLPLIYCNYGYGKEGDIIGGYPVAIADSPQELLKLIMALHPKNTPTSS
jgi:phosphoglycolate phosphatase